VVDDFAPVSVFVVEIAALEEVVVRVEDEVVDAVEDVVVVDAVVVEVLVDELVEEVADVDVV
jgi:hypothetical protein